MYNFKIRLSLIFVILYSTTELLNVLHVLSITTFLILLHLNVILICNKNNLQQPKSKFPIAFWNNQQATFKYRCKETQLRSLKWR